jgi:cyclopropane fatty-acyl-phospholipid synthase-like methyltransferase
MDKNSELSNRSMDWSKIYDFYEIEFRDSYKTISRYQNDSHFALIKHYLHKRILKNDTFAEIGFGAGLTLRYAYKHFKKVIGLDISQKNVELTRSELKKEGFNEIELFVTDIMNKEERFKGLFDVISFIHGLEHFSKDDFPLIFDTVKYYLKPDGVFTVALPNNKDFNYRMCPKCEHVFEIDGHLSRHNRESLSELFRKHNFQIIYLNNFNIHYYRERKGFMKFLYRYFANVILKQISNSGQLEYIVEPN